jgi:hypothetical protein
MDEAQDSLSVPNDGGWPMGSTLVTLDEEEFVAGYSVPSAEEKFGGMPSGVATAAPTSPADGQGTDKYLEGTAGDTSSLGGTANITRKGELYVHTRIRPASRNMGEAHEVKMGKWPLGWDGPLLPGTPTGWGPLLGRLGWVSSTPSSAAAAKPAVASAGQQQLLREHKAEDLVVQQQVWQPPQQLWRQPRWRKQQTQQWQQLQDRLLPGYEEPLHLQMASPGPFGAQEQQQHQEEEEWKQQVVQKLQAQQEGDQVQEPYLIVMSPPNIGRAAPAADKGRIEQQTGQVGPRFAGIIAQSTKAKAAPPADNGSKQEEGSHGVQLGRFDRIIDERMQARVNGVPQQQQDLQELSSNLQTVPGRGLDAGHEQSGLPKAPFARFDALIKQRVQNRQVKAKQAREPAANSQQQQGQQPQKETTKTAFSSVSPIQQPPEGFQPHDKQSVGSHQQQRSGARFAALIQKRQQLQSGQELSRKIGDDKVQTRPAASTPEENTAGSSLASTESVKGQWGQQEGTSNSRFAAVITQRAQAKQAEGQHLLAAEQSNMRQEMQAPPPQQTVQQQEARQKCKSADPIPLRFATQIQRREQREREPVHSHTSAVGPTGSTNDQSHVGRKSLNGQSNHQQQDATEPDKAVPARFSAIINQLSQTQVQAAEDGVDKAADEEQTGAVVLRLPSPVFGAAPKTLEGPANQHLPLGPASHHQHQQAHSSLNAQANSIGHVKVVVLPLKQEEAEVGLEDLASAEIRGGGIAAKLASLKQQRQQQQVQPEHQPWEWHQTELPSKPPHLQQPKQQVQQNERGLLQTHISSQGELQQRVHGPEQQRQQGAIPHMQPQVQQPQRQPLLRPPSPLHQVFAEQPPVVVLPRPYVGRLVRVVPTNQPVQEPQPQLQPHPQDNMQLPQNMQQQSPAVEITGDKQEKRHDLLRDDTQNEKATRPVEQRQQELQELKHKRQPGLHHEQLSLEAQPWQQQEQDEQEAARALARNQPGQQQQLQPWQMAEARQEQDQEQQGWKHVHDVPPWRQQGQGHAAFLEGIKFRQAQQNPRSHAPEVEELEKQVHQQHLKHEQQRQLQKQRLHDLQVAVQKQLQQQQQLEQALVRLALQASGRDEEEMASEALAADQDSEEEPQHQQQQSLHKLELKAAVHDLEEADPSAEQLQREQQEQQQIGAGEEEAQEEHGVEEGRSQSPTEHLSNLFGKLAALIMPIEKQRQQEQQEQQQQRGKRSQQQQQQQQQMEGQETGELQQEGLESLRLRQVGAELQLVHDEEHCGAGVALPPYTNRAFRLQAVPQASKEQQQQHEILEGYGDRVVRSMGAHHEDQRRQEQQQEQQEPHQQQGQDLARDENDAIRVALPPYTSRQFRLSGMVEAHKPQQQQQQVNEKQPQHVAMGQQQAGPSMDLQACQSQIHVPQNAVLASAAVESHEGGLSHQQQYSRGVEAWLNLPSHEQWIATAHEEEQQEAAADEEEDEPPQLHEVCLNLAPPEDWIATDIEEEDVVQLQQQHEYEEQEEVFEFELPSPKQWEEIKGHKVARIVLSPAALPIVAKPASILQQPHQQQPAELELQQHEQQEEHHAMQEQAGAVIAHQAKDASMLAEALALEVQQPGYQPQQEQQDVNPQHQVWLDLPPAEQWLSTAEQQHPQQQQQQHAHGRRLSVIPASAIAKAIVPKPAQTVDQTQQQQQEHHERQTQTQQVLQHQIFGGAAVQKAVLLQQDGTGGDANDDGPFPVVVPPKKATLSAEQLYKRIHTAGRLPDLLQVIRLQMHVTCSNDPKNNVDGQLGILIFNVPLQFNRACSAAEKITQPSILMHAVPLHGSIPV